MTSATMPPRSPTGLLGPAQGDLNLRVRGSVCDGRLLRLSSAKCAIGSSPRCAIRLDSPRARPVHCVILRGEHGSVVRSWSRDTLLNGRPFREAWLNVGDRLTAGPIEFEVLDDEQAETAMGQGNVAEVRWRNERRQIQRRLAESETELRKALRAQEELLADRDASDEQSRQAQEQIERLREEREQTAAMHAEARERFEMLRRSLEDEAEQAREHLKGYQRELRDAARADEQTRRQRDQLQNQLTELELEKSRLLHQVEEAGSQEDRFEHQIALLQSRLLELEGADARSDEMREELDKLRADAVRANRLQDRVEDLEGSLREKSRQCSELQDAAQTAEQTTEELLATIDALETQTAAHEQQRSSFEVEQQTWRRREEELLQKISDAEEATVLEPSQPEIELRQKVDELTESLRKARETLEDERAAWTERERDLEAQQTDARESADSSAAELESELEQTRGELRDSRERFERQAEDWRRREEELGERLSVAEAAAAELANDTSAASEIERELTELRERFQQERDTWTREAEQGRLAEEKLQHREEEFKHREEELKHREEELKHREEDVRQQEDDLRQLLAEAAECDTVDFDPSVADGSASPDVEELRAALSESQLILETERGKWSADRSWFEQELQVRDRHTDEAQKETADLRQRLAEVEGQREAIEMQLLQHREQAADRVESKSPQSPTSDLSHSTASAEDAPLPDSGRDDSATADAPLGSLGDDDSTPEEAQDRHDQTAAASMFLDQWRNDEDELDAHGHDAVADYGVAPQGEDRDSSHLGGFESAADDSAGLFESSPREEADKTYSGFSTSLMNEQGEPGEAYEPEEQTTDPELVFEAPKSEAPINTAEVLAGFGHHVGDSAKEEAEEEPYVAPSWSQNKSPDSAGEAAGQGDEDESIASYMDRLLKRVSGSAADSENSSPAADTEKPHTLQTQQEIAEPVPAEPKEPVESPGEAHEPLRPQEFVPRSQAPEADLAAMRELSVWSSSSALSAHEVQGWSASAQAKKVAGVVLFGVAGAIGLFGPREGAMLYATVAGVAGSLVAALFCLGQATSLVKKSLRSAEQTSLPAEPDQPRNRLAEISRERAAQEPHVEHLSAELDEMEHSLLESDK